MIHLAYNVIKYNVPPWLTTNFLFVILALLILGKESITLDNFDVYLQHVVEESRQLWEVVIAYNVLKPMGSKTFTLKGITLNNT
jgi:hypothetical protein